MIVRDKVIFNSPPQANKGHVNCQRKAQMQKGKNNSVLQPQEMDTAMTKDQLS